MALWRWLRAENKEHKLLNCFYYVGTESVFFFKKKKKGRRGLKLTARVLKTHGRKSNIIYAIIKVCIGCSLGVRRSWFPEVRRRSVRLSRYICQFLRPQPGFGHRKREKPCKCFPVPHNFELGWVNPLRHWARLSLRHPISRLVFPRLPLCRRPRFIPATYRRREERPKLSRGSWRREPGGGAPGPGHAEQQDPSLVTRHSVCL